MAQRDIRSLDVAMLRSFDALLRERSVSRAAARLFLSQPAVSASLNRLRAVFDDRLFVPTGHGVTPTPRALALAPQVQRVLADLSALLDTDAVFDPATSRRVLRIAGSDHQSRALLPALMRQLTALGSPLRIAWEPPGGAVPLAERLERAELDLAVVARLNPPTDLETLALYDDHYVLAVRAGHALAGTVPTLDDFCTVPQVFLGYGTSTLDDWIDQTLARQGRRRRVQVAVTGIGQIADLLVASDHAAVLGSRVVAAFGAPLCALPLPIAPPRYRVLLCWHARAAADPGVRWLRDTVAALAGAAPAAAVGQTG